MRYLTKFFLVLSLTMIVCSSCRNGKQVKQAIEIAKKLSGKTVKASKKGTYLLRYSDDVVRHIEFVTVSCTACDGKGTDGWGDTCEECDGEGYVYKIQTK